MQPILKINLSTGFSNTLSIPIDWVNEYIGGASLAARILFDELVQDLDPFSPDAPLLFITGPLTGTSGPAVGRFVICGRSPATRIWGESNCGGFWGPELRKAGFDGLLITGKADHPVYLAIHNDEVHLHNAAHIWGKDTYETQHLINQELDIQGSRIACIGAAGENLVPFALILCDHGRVAGRTGMGAIMGSKNLKAISVKGTGNIPIAKPEQYNKKRSLINKELRSDVQSTILRDLGTSSSAEYFDYLEELPKRYYRQGKSTSALETSGSVMKETILSGVSSCHACVIACGRVVSLDGKTKQKGPEYETIAGFGPNLLINDLKKITVFGDLCDRYGLDTISMSNIIGLIFDLYERGLITIAETDGLEPVWGDPDNIEKLINMTALNQGVGNLLAMGSRAVAAHFGVQDEAAQVNGLETAYHDPRGSSGMSLVYATSPRGACHNQSDYYIVDLGKTENELLIQYFDRHAGAEKAENVARHQDWVTLMNSLVMCMFANVPPVDILELINLATDGRFAIADLLQVGERAWNLKRVINIRCGLKRLDDSLPNRFLKPYNDYSQDSISAVPDFSEMLYAYYAARNWDPMTGHPNIDKLNQLKLDWVSER